MSELTLEEYERVAGGLAADGLVATADMVRDLVARVREAESKLVETEGREAGLREALGAAIEQITRLWDEEPIMAEDRARISSIADAALAAPSPTRVAELVKHGDRVLACLGEHGFEPGEDPRISDFAQALSAFPHQEQSDG